MYQFMMDFLFEQSNTGSIDFLKMVDEELVRVPGLNGS
ncbi:hypothetical protein SmphiM12_499 [Sinorhizobium phage phiM12]|uniref:Uncharacterized protein n=1 Tax=Sinorhizobium phage phiM12 TaxID=1357423 RepID=A0A068NXM5_9CAUD|nr:hypothetical protein AB690_gp128 [Sinorhizobium phage phiM12]AIF27783.1 hypothetical protein SmphiM12_499 [Sinorhizobium phage phiM12]